jgi:hypothetical protein
LYGFGIAFDIEDRLLELGADSVDGFEGVVLEDFLADFIPEILLGVELWQIGRREEQRDIVGERESAAAMVWGAVDNQKNILLGNFPRQDVKEGLGCTIAPSATPSTRSRCSARRHGSDLLAQEPRPGSLARRMAHGARDRQVAISCPRCPLHWRPKATTPLNWIFAQFCCHCFFRSDTPH